MRFALVSTLVSTFVFTVAVPGYAPAAFAATDKTLDSQQMAALEAKAVHAGPREQCFLYAELAHAMAELAGRQISAGDEADASISLKALQAYAEKIHLGVADDAKKLKNAEILMRHTAFRLHEMMLSASLDDRPTLEATTKQLDRVENEMMTEVFKH